MRFFAAAAAGLMIALAALGAAPVINKAKLEAYLRYAEGFADNVRFVIDDPVASGFPNFYRVNVHLTTEKGGKLDKAYYVTPDGQEVLSGTIWDINRSPFSDTLAHIPPGGYSFGPANAKVQFVIFSDFECPYCRELAKTIRENIPKKYPADVRVTFEDFPLDSLHPWARAAAEASHCVGDQNADSFWAYHDWIFANAESIKPEMLRPKVMEWAMGQKLDVSKLQACMDSHAEANVVKQEEAAGRELQVSQTPTAFVNGRMVPGALPWASLDSVIGLELKGPTGANSTVVSR